MNVKVGKSINIVPIDKPATTMMGVKGKQDEGFDIWRVVGFLFLLYG